MKLLTISALYLLLISNVFPQALPKKNLPAYQTPEERKIKSPANNLLYKSDNILSKANISNRIIPGEFEELQAVLVAWPYPYNYNDTYSVLWSKLIKTIQTECRVWILIDKLSDSTIVKSYLSRQGVSLGNHRFLSINTDAYWTRDYGPWGFYYSTSDSIGFIDPHYYNSRPNDDVVPSKLAKILNIPFLTSKIYMEGGNFMSDGFGRAFFSSRITANNASLNSWTYQQTLDSIKSIFNLSAFTEFPALKCDGGTGHIDMYSKLLDEQTVVITRYPQQVTASDKTTIENIVKTYQSIKSCYNRPYIIHRAPMPTANNSAYPSTCNQIDADPRSYVNGLFVNKTFIMPCYSSANSGNVKGDSDAVAFFRNILPGYRIVPIDSRVLTPLGGAIHCITMQIPATNPIRFWHPSIDGKQVFLPSYHILAKISNKDGIARASCFWRIKGDTEWHEISLADSAGFFTGEIPNISSNQTDTIQYYLSADSHNGKRMTKPITAPAGFRTFWFSDTVSTISGTISYNKSSAAIPLSEVFLADTSGTVISSIYADSLGSFKFDSLPNGKYMLFATTMHVSGGINPLDALLVNKHFLKLLTITDSLELMAADVNLDKGINSTDALLINRRYVNLIDAFPAKSWISDSLTVKLNNNNININIRIICSGDVNSSYNP